MKIYDIHLSQISQKFLDKSNSAIRKQIESRLKNLSSNAVPNDSKFIFRHEGDMVFRYRIGQFRALYKIKEGESIVLIMKIDKRPRIYQDF